MSLNYLEVARSVQEFRGILTSDTRVQAAEVVVFRAVARVPDLCLGLRLENPRLTLVFGLRNPWVGMFIVESNRVAGATMSAWGKNFGEF